MNVRSILPKLDQVHHLLYENEIHILGVGETWLDETVLNAELNIDGYSMIRMDRNRHGGGVMFYVSDSLQYKQFDIDTQNVESIWINVTIDKKMHIIGNIYRPPRSDSNYYEAMLDIIEQATRSSDNVILIGDLNYDYRKDDSLATNPIHFIESMFEMKQLVDSPTRVTTETSTLLDVILSSVPDHHISTRVLPISMSDHFPVITILKSQQKLKAAHKTVRFRDFKHFVLNDFLNDLNARLLNDQNVHNNLNNECDVEKIWLQFKMTFLEVSEAHAPMKTMRMKNRYSPWMNDNILNQMYHRDYLHKKAIRSKCANDWNEYTTQRNNVTMLVKNEKRKYFEDELCKNVKNPKQFWKKINQLTGKNNHVTAPDDISAQNFNDFFSNIGHSVVNDNVSNDRNESYEWKNPACIYTFNFNQCTVGDVSKVIKSLGNDSSLDVLGFDTKLLYVASDCVSSIITKIINLSLSTAKVPRDWKYSRVTPVYKGKGNKDDMNNYRPISVIGHLAKVMEKVVQKQLLHYLLSNDLISIDQSAYRPMHNTQTALHRVIDSWIDNICDGLLTGICLLDIRKCFDTIDHMLLKEKLNYYGIKGVEIDWFSDYLKDRSQAVFHNKMLSDKNNVTIGVPQGSVLGPILFMLFVNDISQNSDIGICNLYADDTIVYCQGDSVQDVNGKLQNCVSYLNEWYISNKLSVNISKCEVMLISSSRRFLSDDLEICIDGQNLKYVNCANYLGMKIDNHLTWNDYVNKLCSNVASKLNRLRRLQNTVSKDVLCKIYLSMIQPCIDYAISVWGQTSQYNILKIQRLQNYAARIVTNNFDYIHCRGINIVNDLKWMNVKKRCDYFTCILMFKCIHGLAPNYLVDDVVMNFDVNGMFTRSHDMNVYVPYVSSQFAKRSFKYSGAILWNELPSFLKDLHNISDFKRHLKCHILS